MLVQETIKTTPQDTLNKLGFKNTDGNYYGIQCNPIKLAKLKNLLSTLNQRIENYKTKMLSLNVIPGIRCTIVF